MKKGWIFLLLLVTVVPYIFGQSFPEYIERRSKVQIVKDNYRDANWGGNANSDFHMAIAKYYKRIINLYAVMSQAEQDSVADLIDDAYCRLGDLYLKEARRLDSTPNVWSQKDVIEKAKRARGYYSQVGNLFQESPLLEMANAGAAEAAAYVDQLQYRWDHRFDN